MLHFHQLKVAEVRPEAEDAVSIRFEVPPALREAYRHHQGQHLNLRTLIDGEEVRRSYSICSAVDETPLTIAVRRLEGGRFSTFANDTLAAGDTLEVMTPTGHFYTELDPANRKTCIAFAAGAGITPIISIIKSTLAVEPHSRFLLFYGNRTRAATIFREEIMDLKNRFIDRFSVHFLLSREATDLELFNGHIDGAKATALLEAFCPPAEVDECFVCGPGTMIDDVTEALARAGVRGDGIHYERFATNPAASTVRAERPEAPEPEVAEDACEVTVVMDAHQSRFSMPREGISVVDAAQARGIELPYSCKAGVCSTCRARLVEGEVEMESNFALEEWEIEAGYVLACQSHPRTERIVLDYDQN